MHIAVKFRRPFKTSPFIQASEPLENQFAVHMRTLTGIRDTPPHFCKFLLLPPLFQDLNPLIQLFRGFRKPGTDLFSIVKIEDIAVIIKTQLHHGLLVCLTDTLLAETDIAHPNPEMIRLLFAVPEAGGCHICQALAHDRASPHG